MQTRKKPFLLSKIIKDSDLRKILSALVFLHGSQRESMCTEESEQRARMVWLVKGPALLEYYLYHYGVSDFIPLTTMASLLDTKIPPGPEEPLVKLSSPTCGDSSLWRLHSWRWSYLPNKKCGSSRSLFLHVVKRSPDPCFISFQSGLNYFL